MHLRLLIDVVHPLRCRQHDVVLSEPLHQAQIDVLKNVHVLGVIVGQHEIHGFEIERRHADLGEVRPVKSDGLVRFDQLAKLAGNLA
jgi:hypothetical protein